MRRAALLGLAIFASGLRSDAAELSGAYSQLRLGGDGVHGASLGFALSLGDTLMLQAVANGQFGTTAGESLDELAMLVGPRLSFLRKRRLSPFVHALGGAVRSRRQVEVFGLAIGAAGVCRGGCPWSTSFASELGGGVDVRLSDRWTLRAAQVDYRLTGLDDQASQWRFSLGIVRR